MYTNIQPVVQPGLTNGWTNRGCSFNTVVKPVVKPVCTTVFDNRVWQPCWMNSLFVQHGCQTGCQKTGCQKTGCQTRLTTGLTTGCIVYTNIQPVVSCKWGIKFLTIIIYYRRRHISTSQTLPLDCLDMSICKVGQLFCSNGTVFLWMSFYEAASNSFRC